MLRLLSARLSALVFSTILISAISSGAARADDCSIEKTLKSPASTVETLLSFQNRSAEKRRIYWIDQDGDRKFQAVVESGNAYRQPTFSGHAWVVTDEAEKCLYTFVASAEPRAVDVGVAAANVVAPPQGAQVPIAQPAAPPPPPVVAQLPPVDPAPQAAPPPAPLPPVVAPTPQVAAPPPPPASPTAAPPQQIAEEPLPQVSPVEQFQLNGAYRLVSQIDNVKVLNSEASGTIYVIAAQPEWDSAQWMFDPVPGTPFVRIKNVWKKTYLADFNGKPRAMAAALTATESHWTFDPVDGTPFVQFRNRETGRFLLAANGAAVLVDDFRQDMENASRWRNAPVSGGGPVAAAIPQRPLYDSALASCRQIGGIWTGSSCLRPQYITKPLACPRGFVWAEDVGECLWDGGRCPPWQIGPGGRCGTDVVCRGGDVAPGPRGFPACYCPPGAVAWGNYPNLSCVPSVTRVLPYLVPAAIGGITLGILSQVYGNNKVCPQGQTGTPPNCRVAATCTPPLVGTPPNCRRLVPRPTPTVLPIVTPTATSTPTPTPTPVIVPTATPTPILTPTPTATPTGTGTNPICSLGQTLVNGRCVNLNDSITCVGGRIEQGVCGCPAGTTLQGSGRNFQCVAANTGVNPTPTPTPTGAGTNPICSLGQTLVNGRCVSLNDSITCTGGRVEQGVCGCPSGTTLTGSGRNFQCVAANTGATPTPTPAPTTTPTPITTPTSTPSTTPTNTGGGGPPVCTDGQNTASGCRCAAPLTALPSGKCTQPTARGAACLEGQNIAQTGCNCVAPLKQIENGYCGRLLLNDSGKPSAGGTCKEGDDIAATKCTCKMNTVDAGGGKFICSSVTYTLCTDGQLMSGANCKCRMKSVKVGNDLYCSADGKAPVVGGAVCSEGQSTAGGCRCVLPLVDLPGGRCGKPTKGGACLEGQNIRQAGCTCNAPMKPIGDGSICGREEGSVGKHGTCKEGDDIRATSCVCAMKTIDQGGGKFICSANAAPSGIRTAPSPTPTPTGRPGTTTAPSPTPAPTPTPTLAPKPVTTPSPTPTPTPTPTLAPKTVVTPSPTPTAVPKPVVAPSPTPAPKPTTAPPPPPKPVTPPPPPPKPVVAPPPPPKPVTAPPPPPKPVTPPPPPPPKPVVAPPPPLKPAPPPACAPPKKINAQGQCV